MAYVDSMLRKMVEVSASDLHLSSEVIPQFRLHGDICPVSDAAEINADELSSHLQEISPDKNWIEFQEKWDSDFGYEIPGCGRFRVNLFMDRKGPGAVFRHIPQDIPTADALRLPQTILDMCQLTKGLVLVTGPTGSGKSTTLAAMVDYINRNRSDHIITIEDPVEFVHQNRNCLINQREVHRHTSSFKTALRAALREDPDIVLVGEMRDLETVEIAIETAETGHLVFGTLHTTTAASTVDRIIDQFPADHQAQIRAMLAGSLKGVVAQTLCKKIGGGRVAAQEILVVNSAVSSLIREAKTYQIPSTMQVGAKAGMVLLNDALMKLVSNGMVEPLEAYKKAADKNDIALKLEQNGFKIQNPEAAEMAPPTKAPVPASSSPQPAASTPTPSAGGQSGGDYADPFEEFRRRKST